MSNQRPERVLTIGYHSRAIGYCFLYFFQKIFMGGLGLDGGAQNQDGRYPLSPTRESPDESNCFQRMKTSIIYDRPGKR